MSDAPDPLGGYHIPFEAIPYTEADVQGLLVDSVNVLAGVSSTLLGTLPLLVIDFASSALKLEQQPHRILFVAPPETLRQFRSLVNQSVAAALKAAAKKGGTSWA